MLVFRLDSVHKLLDRNFVFSYSCPMEKIHKLQANLVEHPVYATFKDVESIRHFMSYHVFAVWDFMSLLKSLQNHLTCTSLPWRPSRYPGEMVRLINQIVLGEESDIDEAGVATSHFDLYLKAMEEVGASTHRIRDFLETMDSQKIPPGAREFVEYNLDVAKHGDVVEVASSFFFGREKLIPEMFTAIVNVLENEKVHAPTLIYYLKRHIEVDGEEHGPLAMKCLTHLTQNDERLNTLALNAGVNALEARRKLWDAVLNSHPTTQTRTP